MKRYNITVNGVTYEVAVEEIVGGATSAAPAVSAPTPTTAPVAVASEPEASPAPAKTPAPAGGNTVKAPMPGSVLKINVQVGDKVESGDLVCILEAMKMENEIFSPVSGTVTAINAPQGTSVSTGEAIITLA